MGALAFPFAVGLTAASSGLSALSSLSAGRTAARIARYNAGLARAQAADALQRGVADEARVRLQTSRLLGAQRAAMGASGVVADQGSGLSILEDTAFLGEMEALTARTNAAREAWGYEAQARGFEFEGRAAKKQAKLAAFGSLLSGASGITGLYARRAG